MFVEGSHRCVQWFPALPLPVVNAHKIGGWGCGRAWKDGMSVVHPLPFTGEKAGVQRDECLFPGVTLLPWRREGAA